MTAAGVSVIFAEPPGCATVSEARGFPNQSGSSIPVPVKIVVMRERTLLPTLCYRRYERVVVLAGWSADRRLRRP